MGHLNVHWSDSLDTLAHAMFANASKKDDPFDTECTVVGSPVMAGWLKQFFLYDFPKGSDTQHVLACWDFKMLHPFVNDWLAKAHTGTEIGNRNPAQHPYSCDVLQWRIWIELSQHVELADYAALRAYIGEDPLAMDRKRWGLAQRLAQLFDDYQNYRPDWLMAWQDKKAGPEGCAPPGNLSWQAVLWRALLKENPETYQKQFLAMDQTLPSCGINQAYRRITVFHTSAMPRAYMQFFVELANFMPVEMFIFNPSKDFWLDNPPVKQQIRELSRNGDTLAWMAPANPLLSGFGRGTQAFLATLLDVTDGNIHDSIWGEDQAATLLDHLQTDIRNGAIAGKPNIALAGAVADDSIQLHVCHSPLREVEVAKDLILKWFEAHPDDQPRDVQVLVPDMETYAPFIESVFRVTDFKPPIPCAISKRPAVSAGAIGVAFVRLMQFNECRMSAPEAIEILELDPVRERYQLEPDDVSEIRTLVNTANIRWGRDGEHLSKILSHHPSPPTQLSSLPDTVTWRRGLDRLIAGFAIGRCADGDDMINAGPLGSLHLCDGVEGGTAERVGKLARFYEDLCTTADEIEKLQKRKVSAWAQCYTETLERFFLGTESSFKELAEIRSGIKAVEQAALSSGDPDVPAGVMAAAIESQLGGMAPAGKAETNAVLFSPLHTMQVTPRKLILLLGLNEGAFPRADLRPGFDLLALKPRYGDRSLRYEDRLAFLEAIMSARERLIITYTGRNIANNKEVPPSPAVTEFLHYLNNTNSSAREKDPEKKVPPLVKPIEHKLHGFNPVYYITKEGNKLVSYSRSNHAAACVIKGKKDKTRDITQHPSSEANANGSSASAPTAPEEKSTIELKTLQAFFANPARHFFNTVLQIRLPDPSRDTLFDSELFDGDTLDDYTLNKLMIEDILNASGDANQAILAPADDYYDRLREQALIPLGTFGLGATRKRLDGLLDFLNNQAVTDGPLNLYQSLRAAAQAVETTLTVTLGNTEISASLPLMEHSAEGVKSLVLLRFRYAGIKAKDRINAWLAHLVGHAAGERFKTVIAGKDKGKLKTESIQPIEKTEAETILAAILTQYRNGGKALIPFAPETSYAYTEQIVKDGDIDTAFEKAEAKWCGFGFTEIRDNYLLAAWKEDGPMEHPDFAMQAGTFWGKFIPPPAKAEPSGNATDANNPEERS